MLERKKKNYSNQLPLGATLMQMGEINAVHNSDLEKFLKSLGEYEKVIEGKVYCYFCRDVISLDSLQSVFPQDNEIKYCCNKTSCYASLIERGKANNGIDS